MRDELDVALDAARIGTDVVHSFEQKNFDYHYKGVNDLVTDADVATQEAVVEVIREHFPDDYILAEESEDEHKLPTGRAWIIDPIDGTTNFAYGFPVYCVSVGFWADGEPEAAAVIEVNRNEEFTARRDGGAWLNGRVIRVSEKEDPDKALIGTGFPYNDHSMIEEYYNLFRTLSGEVQGIRRPGSAAYDLCCVAAGRFQGFYEYALKAWDVAAAGLIVKEAGGVVTDWERGDEWLTGERIVAGNSGIHDYLLRRIHNTISAPHCSSIRDPG
ncbi:MAG: inositol monophosphatase family protein [Balneolaceae bacterium]